MLKLNACILLYLSDIPLKNLFYILCLFSLNAYAVEYEGFTEPDRKITIAPPEAGVLESIAVKEGDKVKAGQVLASLENRVFRASLAVAKAKKAATGRLNSAVAIERLRREKLDRLLPLLAKGNAQPYEIAQSRIELESSVAEVQAARETLNISELEYKQIEAQIEHRILRSPIDGVVINVNKEVAELASFSGTDAQILTVASLDPLRISLRVPTAQAVAFKPKQGVSVRFPNLSSVAVNSTIHLISPVTDASSDTVKVDILLENPKGELRSGVKCLVTVQ